MLSNSQGVNWKGEITRDGKNTDAPGLRWVRPVRTLAVALALAVAALLPAAAPASAATCHVSVWHTKYTWNAHRTSGTCRIEAWARDRNGRALRGPDVTTRTSTAWDNVPLVAGGWNYS